MSWRDDLREASFRGISFKIRSHDYSVGRRNVLHQYPFRDDPYAEDLGLDADEFRIEGYVIQNLDNGFNYFEERDKLIKALKEKGPGKLIHPFLGEKNVIVIGKQNIREEFTRNAGMARFYMYFVIASNEFDKQKRYSVDVIDPVVAVDEKAEKVLNDASDNFYDQWLIEGQPLWVIQNAYNDFHDFTYSMKASVNKIRSTTGSSLESIKMTFDDARSTILEIAAYPCQVAGLINDMFESVLGLANLVGDGYVGDVIGNCSGQVYFNRLDPSGKAIEKQLGYSMTNSLTSIAGTSETNGYGVSINQSISDIGGALEDIPVTTETRAREAVNRLALINFIRSQAISAAMRAAIRIDYDSLQQAKDMLDNLINSMNLLLVKLGDESAGNQYADYGIYIDNRDLYGSLQDLKSTFVKSMREKKLGIAVELVYESPPDGTTSLTLAYEQYKDLDREDEIYLENKSENKHPGFLFGDLRILNE